MVVFLWPMLVLGEVYFFSISKVNHPESILKDMILRISFKTSWSTSPVSWLLFCQAQWHWISACNKAFWISWCCRLETPEDKASSKSVARHVTKIDDWEDDENEGQLYTFGVSPAHWQWKVKVYRGPFIKMKGLLFHFWWVGDTPNVYSFSIL